MGKREVKLWVSVALALAGLLAASGQAALGQGGSVWGWGVNAGALGDGTEDPFSAFPVQALGYEGVGYLADVVGISAGYGLSAALKSDGSVWMWGSSSYGGLGSGPAVQYSNTPVRVVGPDGSGYLPNVVAISCGLFHVVVLKSDGTVWTWGYNQSGQLGDDSQTHRNVPVQVKGPGGSGHLADIVAAAAGGYHTLALSSDGTVWAWGHNGSGQLGNGGTGLAKTPMQVVGPGGTGHLSGVVALAGGATHTMALRIDGTVWAWGYNEQGQLGNGTNVNSGVPVQVGGLTGVKAIAAGSWHSLALKSDGTVWAWGWNSSSGQLGDGTVTDHWAPVQVVGYQGNGTLTSMAAIAAGGFHSLALKSDDTTWAWGYNDYGVLGGNPALHYSATPVPVMDSDGVGDFTGAAALAAGYLHSLALRGPLPTYTLTATASPPQGGTVVPVLPLTNCRYGEPLPLMATPGPGYRFAGWTGDIDSVIDPSAADTICFMTGHRSVTAAFAPIPLEIAASLDLGWVYQNTSASTMDRLKSVLTVSITSGNVDGETYAITVGENGGALTNFQATQPMAIVPGTPQAVSVLGGRRNTTVPSPFVGGAYQPYTLNVTVTVTPSSRSAMVNVPLVLRMLCDIDGDGAVTAADKLEMNKSLNGLATLPGIGLRELDLTGDGTTVNAEDKLILNQVLNGLLVP